MRTLLQPKVLQWVKFGAVLALAVLIGVAVAVASSPASLR
jgi:hypothetical protein